MHVCLLGPATVSVFVCLEDIFDETGDNNSFKMHHLTFTVVQTRIYFATKQG